jgi:iron complex outermembrane receptor protein
MTWQTKDRIALSDTLFEDENGEAGQPIFVADFNVALESGPWSLFWGMDVIGGTDDREDWLDNNADLCPTFTVYPGQTCLDLTTDATFYHAISVTREFEEHFRVTAGISNLFDTHPPRTSQVGGDGIQQFGLGNFYSQYDNIGRSGFINLNIQY